MSTIHVPILRDTIRDFLVEPFRQLASDAPPHTLIDCTLGGGGHTEAFLEALSSPGLERHRVLAIDQDETAIARARARFAGPIAEGRLGLRHARFSEIELASVERPLGILADLGFSSDQLEDASRGLSFQSDGPLDMRFDRNRGESALAFLGRASESEIADMLWELGEERFSRRIARSLVLRRQGGNLPKTTAELADLVVRSLPPPARHGRIHAATRTFQALRIQVNDELGELESLLGRVILDLQPGGRVAVLSFHSLEDRKVKLAFRDRERFRALTKKPIEAGAEESRSNPRSRSAKLRVAERIA